MGITFQSGHNGSEVVRLFCEMVEILDKSTSTILSNKQAMDIATGLELAGHLMALAMYVIAKDEKLCEEHAANVFKQSIALRELFFRAHKRRLESALTHSQKLQFLEQFAVIQSTCANALAEIVEKHKTEKNVNEAKAFTAALIRLESMV